MMDMVAELFMERLAKYGPKLNQSWPDNAVISFSWTISAVIIGQDGAWLHTGAYPDGIYEFCDPAFPDNILAVFENDYTHQFRNKNKT